MSPGMGRKHSHDDPHCVAIRQILDRVGDKWSLYIVEALQERPLRFNELKRSVDGISQRMLTLTLQGLERDGLVTRTVFAGKPLRVEYALTELGRTLLRPVTELVQWALSNQSNIEKARLRYDRTRERNAA